MSVVQFRRKKEDDPQYKLQIKTPWRERARRWWRVAKILVPVLALFGVFEYGEHQYYDLAEEWEHARNCMALASNLEGNVLDQKGELLVQDTVINRAEQIPGTADFFHKSCQAALAKHWNKRLDRNFQDFSALAGWQYQTKDGRYGWERSYNLANQTLIAWFEYKYLGWLPYFRPLDLPSEYTYYHNSPAPDGWKKENGGLDCGLRHPYKVWEPKKKIWIDYSLDFCKPGGMQIVDSTPLPPARKPSHNMQLARK